MWLIKQTNMVEKYLHKSLCSWIHVTGNSILLNKAAIPDMTHRKWTTDEQEAWLEQRKLAFLEANQKKTAAKDFFPAVVEEFCQKWPVLPVTEQEILDAGSVELATRVKQNKYDEVNNSCTQSQGKRWLTHKHSAHQGGFPIIHES